VGVRSCRHAPNSTKNKIVTPTIHIDSKKWFFRPPKLCCPPSIERKKTFKSTLNVMILQMIRSECVRFGGHVGIEVSYKVLQLEVLMSLQF
jgi:hypothetical protein